MPQMVVEAQDVAVELGSDQVFAGLELRIGPGDIVAVVGANGAGKSTLLRCLAGLQRGVTGKIAVFDGPPVDEPRFWRDVALMGDEPAWYPGLTVREHLELMPAVHGSARMPVATALETFGLARRSDTVPLSLSTGERQRLSLAMTLLRPSRLLLLDEPERGLDPAFRDRLAAALSAYAAEGGTVVLATHDPGLVAATRARRLTLTAP